MPQLICTLVYPGTSAFVLIQKMHYMHESVLIIKCNVDAVTQKIFLVVTKPIHPIAKQTLSVNYIKYAFPNANSASERLDFKLIGRSSILRQGSISPVSACQTAVLLLSELFVFLVSRQPFDSLFQRMFQNVSIPKGRCARKEKSQRQFSYANHITLFSLIPPEHCKLSVQNLQREKEEKKTHGTFSIYLSMS